MQPTPLSLPQAVDQIIARNQQAQARFESYVLLLGILVGAAIYFIQFHETMSVWWLILTVGACAMLTRAFTPQMDGVTERHLEQSFRIHVLNYQNRCVSTSDMLTEIREYLDLAPDRLRYPPFWHRLIGQGHNLVSYFQELQHGLRDGTIVWTPAN